MHSTSFPEYQAACAEILRGAIFRPAMWYRSLPEFEAFLSGHAVASQQMCSIRGREVFPDAFARWLVRHMSFSCVCGWAYEIEQHCAQSGEATTDVFNRLVSEFLEEWIENSPASS